MEKGLNNYEILCYLLEYQYLEMFKKENITDEDSLFTSEWYTIFDFETKIKILVEAIDNNQKIIDTNLYESFLYDLHI